MKQLKYVIYFYCIILVSFLCGCSNLNSSENLEKHARHILNNMTLHEKVCQLFIVRPEDLTGVDQVIKSGETTKVSLQEMPVGGIIYFAKNIQTPEQTTEMIKKTQEYSKIKLFICVDEEGGLVSRIGSNELMGTTFFPSMAEIGKFNDFEKAYNVGYTIGKEISVFGFNLDFAPVADINSNPENNVIGNRAFSNDPHIVAQMVSACVKGFKDSGILCCIKHFPGHGDTMEDSHDGLAKTMKAYSEIKESDLLPFIEGINMGVPMIMVGHISVPDITGDDTPSTLSVTVLRNLLREDLGFKGLIITDAMEMGAITKNYGVESSLLALQAGADIILMPPNVREAVSVIEDAVKDGSLEISRIDESVLRIIETKLSI